MRPSWRSTRHAGQWDYTLTKYAAALRLKPVNQIQTADVLLPRFVLVCVLVLDVDYHRGVYRSVEASNKKAFVSTHFTDGG
jgi:hypothetical protein